MSSSPPPPPQPPRSFPAPCWAHDETVALIHAYRDKCSSLGRRTLRSNDWDEVASAVALQCPSFSSSSSSPKSSVQCRHKMEKLRRRYRAEKQRCASYSGRIFSSWDLFHLLDSVEAGSEVEMDNAKSRGRKNPRDVESDYNQSFSYDSRIDGGPKFSVDRNDVVLGLISTNPPKDDRNFSLNSDIRQHKGSRYPRDVSSNNHYDGLDNADPIPVGVRIRSRVAERVDPDYDGIVLNAPSGGNLMSSRCKSKKHSSGGIFQPHFVESDESDQELGFQPSSSFRPESRGVHAHVKREINPFTEIASSIRLLGDEFVRMERMKMDMAREFEKTRMSFEMKRNQMIIKSEQMIVSAFMEAVHGNRRMGKVATSET
ncbi:hypothetical protein SAY87_015096 [Trapa incisa]|uniref:Myb/SANT-like DNA-binding domain-containing protein n=1 Tax=Trapa incisa TaxID=236973 RepID=A0AAN7JLN8_9MYRT|nr:hypothetical protein SAY87_015096 [Trapa incisa]